MSLVAHLEPETAKSERRSSRRRKLRLQLKRQVPPESLVVIHDLSEQGMLLEGDAGLAAGDAIDLVLPGAGSNEATVIWNRGRYFGCEFAKPISSAAVSAVQLRSPPPPSDDRKRAIYNAMAELNSLAKVVEQVTEQVEKAIADTKGRRDGAI